MSITTRSRLGCIKSKQKRLQRKLEKLHPNSEFNSDVALEKASAFQPKLELKKQAWEQYLLAKAIYEETRDSEHWRYMQKCISDYEKTLKAM